MSRIQYPKLLLLAYSFVLAYLLFMMGAFDALPVLLQGQGYFSMFLGGLLFSFGFTTPFAIAIFVEMAPTVHPLLGAVIAGMGAVIADTTIFEFIRFSFVDELHKLRTCSLVRYLQSKLHHKRMPERIRQYILWSLAGIVIASPLPDEIGVSMLSGMTNMKSRPLVALCFTFNTLGIIIILLIAH